MNRSALAKIVLIGLVLVAGACFLMPTASAQEEHGEEAVEAEGGSDGGLSTLGLGISAALAVGLAGLATGMAQAAVGSGGTGALAEKPELFANILILFAIPETIVLFGFVIAILLLNKI